MNPKIITLFSLFGELERDLVSLRTKEALAAKKSQGIKLGKPKGTIQKSKFDKDIERIKKLLDIGLSVRKIARLLGYSNNIGLNTYVKKRNLRESMSQTQQEFSNRENIINTQGVIRFLLKILKSIFQL